MWSVRRNGSFNAFHVARVPVKTRRCDSASYTNSSPNTAPRSVYLVTATGRPKSFHVACVLVRGWHRYLGPLTHTDVPFHE